MPSIPLTCGGGFVVGCIHKEAKDAAESIFDGAFDAIAKKTIEVETWILKTTLTWWVDSPFQLNLQSNHSVVDKMHEYLMY
ncbi:hypothetical protein MXD61_08900 [Frankia sp. AgPm24]|uniref:hypothetical protein n=1 Tax=Frankia sp. AgPm24 TaxID=631128 RepID=UPI00200C5E03|nr:hypothetical protein [Frankia sp. AgPm24]MCK9921999.1 hypothetical protein [Frankia sp. AgPm24]